ncbi:glycine zipper 2TM domain-containing protein [Actimicrobium sp. CCI2.3]|uniref:glycine zipper 2TM domain-containing protein n=1 Tax=Actimicrobium sp. CCI2.3 TaxID=3048616 RepID=UPI002AB4F17E|nr:glycine zipper 2TM domain-containing protein [Actimicrobium sp. CCI2.3]MDY7575562.1 glycine zipper 2TM domain-containing protein [Actimicrobium sp. CCI2.3]MEB0022825.1 glycine zipper 2TM domain-containing protein [Actimicrobium sp. CCI2.3]
MKTSLKTTVAFLLAGAFSGTVFAADFEDTARVVRVVPQVEQFNQPQQECHNEYVQGQRQERNIGGSILGGLAGGLLGNQVGGGSGRTAATAAGAIAGAIVGDRVENTNQQPSEQVVRQCRTVDNWQSRTNGYAVTYEYNGRTYTSVMPYDPGERLRLRVSLNPRN